MNDSRSLLQRAVSGVRRRFLFFAVAAGLSAAFACAAEHGAPPGHPRKSLLSSTEVTPAYPSPAIWRYHPKKEAALRVRRKLSGGRELYAGDRGERWLFDTHKKSVRAAARLAPEALVSILQLEHGGWLFVGQSGTTYEAEKPLGPFVRSSAPLDPLAHISAAASTLMGVRRDGVLVQSSDAGASWHVVGPKQTRFSDVALDEKGRGLALATPEALYETRDRGSTWKRLDRKTSGVLSVQRHPDDSIDLVSVLGVREWKPDAPAPFVARKASKDKTDYKLPTSPPRGPDASALSAGLATIVDNRYFELTADEHGSYAWRLLSGPVDGKLVEQGFSAAKGCRAVRIAGFGHWLYLACSKSSSGRTSMPITLISSKDSGEHWKKEDYPAVGNFADFRLAVGAGGALLVTGVCPPNAAGSGCGVQGVYYRRRSPEDAGAPAKSRKDSGAKRPARRHTEYELAPAATPALKASADALAFSNDGRTAFAVGHRTKNGAFTVFVSHNGGQSFEAHEIEQIPADYQDSYYGGYSYRSSHSSTQVGSVMAAEDGTLAIVATRYGTSTLLVTDDDGRVVSLSHAPSSQAVIGAVGTRALAVSGRTRDAWESLDGGATWDSIGGLPLGVCPKTSQCKVPVYCYPGGCVVGDQLSRIGWRGQADADEGVLSPPDSAPRIPYDRTLREPISCTLDGAGWKALDGLDSAPAAERAELGKAVWCSGAVADAPHAAAWVYQATGGAHPHVEKVTLLSPAHRPETMALAVDDQVEGAAALRYVVPDGVRATRIRNVEVAWDNLLEGRLVHARVADGGAHSPNDYIHMGSGRADLARPALLSIAWGGLYLRLHYGSQDNQTTLFLDGHGESRMPAVSWPKGLVGYRSEMVHAGHTHMPVKFGAVLARAVASGGAYRFDAETVGLVAPYRFGLVQRIGLTYLHGHAGAQVTLQDIHGGQHQSRFFPFRDSGAVVDPPIPLPMQEDLPDRPSRCSNTQERSTARAIQGAADGTRHPVIVADANEPLRALLTESAVMYGTPSSPCVAAFDAKGVRLEGGELQGESAILPIDDLDHAWLFRTSPGSTSGHIEYRTMKCRFDPNVEVPPELYGGTATSRTTTPTIRRPSYPVP